MTDNFLGEIRMFAGNFAPNGWAFCDGQILPINQNTALFSLLGTTYGGDGIQTFALPDLRDRAPVSFGNGPGLTPRNLGEVGGSDTVSLLPSELPAHSHAGSSKKGTLSSAVGAVPAAHGRYTTAPVQVTGGAPHNNRPPYLGLSFIIALTGIFPSRS
jgi:microcystin-dependent protein